MKNWLLLFGRMLLASVFLFSMVGQIDSFGSMVGYMDQYGVPYASFWLVTSMILRAVGSASLVLGIRTDWGVAILTLFLIPASLIFHTDFSQPMELIAFMENMGLQGGLLLLAASGPGKISFEGVYAQRGRVGRRRRTAASEI
jgi:putative oxidoreductase